MYRSERYVVAVEFEGTYFKLMQFMFSRKDGSLFVAFPYFQHSEGIAAEVPLPESRADIRLSNWGKVTSHLVKYSHHPDGRAHFSQDGRVRTEIRKQSIPIERINGHTFTLQIQALDAFEKTREDLSRSGNRKRKYIIFRAKGKLPNTMRIVGRWYSLEVLRRRVIRGKMGEIPDAILASDQKTPLYICSTSEGLPGEDRAMLVNVVAMDSYTNPDKPSLVFCGGFDLRLLARYSRKPATFLVLSYPAENFEELEKSIGSFDFHPE